MVDLFKGINLPSLNIFGIFTVYKRVLIVIAEGHNKASDTTWTAAAYQFTGIVIMGNLANMFSGIAGFFVAGFLIWFFLPFVMLDYDNKYGDTKGH